jgi:folylpolyglutamate synthase/dihydrofolate synthase
VEVGMGGRLDSTNVLNNQAISVISKIARDHEGFLGNTLSEIAGHKAGILRPSVPYIINSTNEANVQSVIEDYAQAIGAGPRLLPTTWELQQKLYDSSKWNRATNKLLPFQQENLKLAVVAVMKTLESMDESTNPKELAKTLLVNASHRNPGRQEFLAAIPVFREASHRENQILVDGAHNPDAARTLDEFVQNNLRLGQSPRAERPDSGWPVTWVLAMTEGKDAREYLTTILKPGDKVVTTTFGPVDGMPWVKSMDPQKLLEIARSVEPSITGVHVPIIGALRALCTAKYISDRTARWAPIALTGSLYLVGDLHRELRTRQAKTWWTDPATHADREALLRIHAEERERVSAILGVKGGGASLPGMQKDSATEEQRKLQEELDALTREAQELEIEEDRLVKDQTTSLGSTGDDQALSAVERLELEDRRFAELHATPEQLVASLARAEKAKEALVRQQIAIEYAAKARQEKQEKRLAQKQRLEERRDTGRKDSNKRTPHAGYLRGSKLGTKPCCHTGSRQSYKGILTMLRAPEKPGTLLRLDRRKMPFPSVPETVKCFHSQEPEPRPVLEQHVHLRHQTRCQKKQLLSQSIKSIVSPLRVDPTHNHHELRPSPNRQNHPQPQRTSSKSSCPKRQSGKPPSPSKESYSTRPPSLMSHAQQQLPKQSAAAVVMCGRD